MKSSIQHSPFSILHSAFCVQHSAFCIPLLLLVLTACDNHNQPTPPTYDTTVVTVYDTTYRQTLRCDTVAIDTLVRDTLVDVQNDRVVVGYVQSWLDGIPDPFLNTNLCYMGATPDITPDSVYTGFTVMNPNVFKRVVALKEKNPNLKISLSFANSDVAGGFSHMLKNPDYRHKFAEDCLEFCQSNGIDGIDLDWEFPGKGSDALTDVVHDVDNYTAVFKELREVMGPNYLLTVAGYITDKETVKDSYGNKLGYRGIDLKKIEPYLDWINLMCYDYDQGETRHCPHNAFMGGQSDNGSSVYWSIIASYRAYLAAKYPMNKLVLGIAFYGRHSFVNSKEYQYKEIEDVLLKNFPNIYTKKYNTTWQVPCLYKNGEFFCSYDDPQSIAYKGGWAVRQGLKGLMYWSSAGDNNKKDLQHACWDAMKKELITDTTFTYQVDSLLVTDTIITERRDTTITKHPLASKR
ncbi:MAG: glycosyl hydrolase family 18 protein [Paludibacteraceae bacterium]|nr:glycosyl hydrolase family 18 protein [Paludibacteraceae bacterium]